jgi:hypothetical protein
MNHIENDASDNSSIVVFVFVANVMFLLSNDRGIHIQAHRLMGEIYEVCH